MYFHAGLTDQHFAEVNSIFEPPEMLEQALSEILSSPPFEVYCACYSSEGYRGPRHFQKPRDSRVYFDAVGVAGESISISVHPVCLFRGNTLITEDSADPAGSGTVVEFILVHTESQMPPNRQIPTSRVVSLGPLPIRMDICEPGMPVTMRVRFLKDCTFSAIIRGKSIL